MLPSGAMQSHPFRVAARVVALLALGWLGYGLGAEVLGAVRRQAWGLDPPGSTAVWRYGTPTVARFRHVVTRLDATIPKGAQVAFDSPGAPPSSAFYRYMWAAYFLPRRDLLPSSDPRAWTAANFWLTFGTRPSDPRLTLVREWRAGAVYRVAAP